jgi:hypothetical protein
MKCDWLAAQRVSDLESHGRGDGSPSEDSRAVQMAATSMERLEPQSVTRETRKQP